MKHGEETIMPNWVLEVLESLALASDMKMLCWLARHGGYRQSIFSTKQLAIALEIDLRTVQSGVVRLADAGHILSADGQHCIRNAAARLPQGFYKSTRLKSDMEPRQERENPSLNLRTDELKELEELKNKKEEENTPLTPEGEARNPAAPLALLPEPGAEDETTPATPEQPTLTGPDLPASASSAKGPEKVPRRRAAPLPIPPLPADLAALPGLSAAWDVWLQYRIEKKLDTPPTTAEAQFVKLRHLHGEGQDVLAVIAHAIEHTWKSFFPVKSEAQQRGNLKFQLTPPGEKSYEERYS